MNTITLFCPIRACNHTVVWQFCTSCVPQSHCSPSSTKPLPQIALPKSCSETKSIKLCTTDRVGFEFPIPTLKTNRDFIIHYLFRLIKQTLCKTSLYSIFQVVYAAFWKSCRSSTVKHSTACEDYPKEKPIQRVSKTPRKTPQLHVSKSVVSVFKQLDMLLKDVFTNLKNALIIHCSSWTGHSQAERKENYSCSV